MTAAVDAFQLSSDTMAQTEVVCLYSSDAPGITVCRPTQSDMFGVAALFSEMQRHYGQPVPDERALEAAMLACRPVSSMFDPRVMIAAMDGAIVGSIALNVTFPARELTQALYVRDLYVAQSARRRGVGRALVRAAARLTFAEGFSALDWTTATDNAAARQMYESCGAQALRRTYYRIARDDICGDLQGRLVPPHRLHQ
jgi:ribosomal protein S18 acetylase RimI-like enzyme